MRSIQMIKSLSKEAKEKSSPIKDIRIRSGETDTTEKVKSELRTADEHNDLVQQSL